MKREYTINELASILGCSRTAIVKKIKPDENNPVIKRYRGRYEVVSTNNGMAILLDDIDIEHEKSISKGVNNVSNNTGDRVINSDFIDVEPERETVTNNNVLSFTERYIEQFATLQKEMYNEIKQRDNQILLLTTSEQAKQNEYLQAKAENKTLKKRNTILTVILGVTVTVLICIITFGITYMTLNKNVTDINAKKIPAQQEIPAKPVKK